MLMELIQRRHTCETTLGNAARRLGVTTSITCTHFTLDIYPSFSGTSVLCIIQPMPMLADHRICRRYRATRVTMPLQGNLQWPSTLVCRITQFDQVNLERSNTLSLSLPPRGTVQQFRDHAGTFNTVSAGLLSILIYDMKRVIHFTTLWEPRPFGTAFYFFCLGFFWRVLAGYKINIALVTVSPLLYFFLVKRVGGFTMSEHGQINPADGHDPNVLSVDRDGADE